MAKKLFIPGPVEVHKDILAAMSVPMMGHRSSDYAALHKRTVEKLRKLLYTEGRVFLSTSSAFGVMEGAVKNLVQKRCANFCNGAFSAKWHDVTKRCGIEADAFKAEWGEPITPEMVEGALKTGKYDAITVVHNETSTGVMSPLEEIAKVMKKYPEVSFIVDTVSSMSGTKVEVDAWGLDVCVASVQKAFGLPPGLAVFSVSDRALKKAETTPNRGYYFDFIEFAENDAKHNTPSTPCISQIYALDVQLDRIFKEGAEERFARHAKMAKKTQDWILSHGLELFAGEGYRSHTLTSGKNNKNIDLESLKKKLGERGYAFDNGYGKVKNLTFRIAHMADIMPEDLDDLFRVIEAIWAGK